MAMRDLVTGGGACAVPCSSSSSNPFGALSNAILGSSMKAQDFKGLPESRVIVPNASSNLRPEDQLTSIPGSEYKNQLYQQSYAQSSVFLRGILAVMGVLKMPGVKFIDLQFFPMLGSSRVKVILLNLSRYMMVV